MKTVQKGQEIKRVDDTEAESLVRHKGYTYVPKSVHKEQFKTVTPTVVVEAKTGAILEGLPPKTKFKKGNKK